MRLIFSEKYFCRQTQRQRQRLKKAQNVLYFQNAGALRISAESAKSIKSAKSEKLEKSELKISIISRIRLKGLKGMKGMTIIEKQFHQVVMVGKTFDGDLNI